MNNFKKNDRFGGGEKRGGFGGKSFGRPSFGGRPSFRSGDDRGFGRDKEMFRVTCASCNQPCEVPFKPNGKKPVYCKECFAANGGPASEPKRFDRPREFAPRKDFDRPSFRPERREGDSGMSDVKRQIEVLNTKLDKLMEILGGKNPAPKKEDTAPASDSSLPKVSEKKAKKSVSKKKK